MQLNRRLILASKSPRRIGLLKQIGLNAEIIPSSVEEQFEAATSPAENAARLALLKAQDVGVSIDEGIVIGADTIVALDGRMLGKPVDEADACRMLELLSGRTHAVYTGLTLIDRPSNRVVTEVEATHVTFRQLPQEEIRAYVASGSPLDKAGAYGIQDDYGAVFVTRIEGCFYNVMGFPLAKFYTMLRQFQSQLTTQ